jgi:nucleoside-diphosphate-sugar epimerase
MRVAVTGASGRVGQFVVRDLLARGCTVRAWTRGKPLPEGVESVAGDLGDRASMQALCRGADLLVHLALAHVPGRYRGGEGDDPARFVALNLHGSHALLRAAREAAVARCVVLSSRAVLDGCQPGSHDERTATRPTALYGHIKAALEAFVVAAGADWGLAALRATGVYGVIEPPSSSKWFALVRDARGGQFPERDRAGTEVHGQEVADAIWRLATTPETAGGIYNCSDLVVRSSDVLQLAGIKADLPPVGDPTVTLNCSRLKGLGWRPGGAIKLRQTISALKAAARAPRSATEAR